MRRMVREWRRNPAIRQVSAEQVAGLPRKAWFAEIRTIFNAVRDNVRYTLDVNEVETIQDPLRTMQLGFGDCDDMATLLATMLESIGHPTKFVAISLEGPEDFSHVFVATLAAGEGQWISLDATEPYAAGWTPPGIRYRLEIINGS